jgi:streptogramin lyase
MPGVTLRRLSLVVVTFLLGLLGLTPPAHAGGVFIVITGINVGSPVMGTQDSCNGWVQHNVPVVPVTISASFFGDDPVGPYATAEWGGGFGSWDDHFGTGVAHDHFQRFHILVRASLQNGWHGADKYWFQGLVQDVGLGGGFAVRVKDVYLPPPSPTVAKVKCTITPPLGPQYVLDQVMDAALDQLKEAACELCMKAKGLYDTLKGYSDALDGLMYDSMVDDPPDPNYQTLATPTPAPVLPPPAGLTGPQLTAYTQLATQLATDVGIGRAIYATVNRVWGADNAASTYWHRRQLTQLATLTDQMATGLDALPPLWTAMVDSLTGLPEFTVGPSEVNATMSGLGQGLKPERAAVLTQLGVTDAEQRKIAELFAMYVNPNEVQTTSSTEALSGTNATALAQAMRTWGDWARSAVEDDPPVVTSVSPATLPTSGGGLVQIEGSHLQHVTGVNFGPSSPGHGQGDLFGNCQPTSCTVWAPPGQGTVDVVAVGPGGTSKKTPGDQLTYSEPDVPHVTSVYPAVGPLAGNNTVSVFGSGLAGGRVDFGAVTANSWRCRPTRCDATVPASGLAGPVHVTVVNGNNRSDTSAADQYTYSATAPPPPGQPTVTQVTPSSGTHLGGQQVTITGTNLTGASTVVFGDGYDADEFAVTDDSHITLTTPSMEAGANDVVVYGPGGASATTAGDVFTATEGDPTITSVSPDTGSALGGTEVTLTGTNLTDGFIEVGEAFTDDNVCSATKCTFTTRSLPVGAPLGPTHVQVSTIDGQSTPTPADLFTFTPGPAPEVTGLDPDTGPTAGGGILVVTGHNLNGGQVKIGGTTAEAAGMSQYCSNLSCVVEVPPHAAGDVDVRVQTHAGTSAANAASTYSYIRPPRPVVTGISPNEEWAMGVGDITITGHNLDGGTVFFGGVEAFNADCTSSECSLPYAPWPDAPGTVDVTVQTAGGTSATGPQTKFTWIAPTITSVSPASGWNDGSVSVTVTGTHLKGGSITFGSRIADEACGSDTTCVVTAPRTSGGATGQVDVVARAPDGTTPSAVTAASKFTYTARPLPTVTSLSPNHGSVNGKETVTLTGTDLQGASKITLAGISATIKGCTATSCTFVSPIHATGAVPVVVTTSAGNSVPGADSTFTYEAASVPTITSVSPASGSTVGGTTVTLTGTHLAGATIRFATSQQSATCEATSCTVTTAAHAAGTLDVTAQNVAGTSPVTADTKFTYVVPPVPTITALTPDSGPASGGAAMTLTGTDLRGAQVSFGGTAVTETCTDTQCTFAQPATPAGDMDVTVTTQGGTSAGTTFHVDTITLTEHAIPGVTGTIGIGEIIRGIGGDLWFAMHDKNAIGRVQSDGSILTYPTPAGSGPYGITFGPDGRMWFTEPGSSHIGAMDGSGNLTEYPVAAAPDDLRFITPGPDGRLWFNLGSGAIGAITTAGVVTEYPVPDPTVVPYHVLAGPDGRIWFTEWGGGSIGAITTDGVVTEYPLSAVDLTNWDLKTGPDGRLWFTQTAGPSIAAVDTATGEVTTYHLPLDVENPQGMVWGPDGRFWFVTPNVQRVAAWNPDTDELSYYPLPTANVRTPKYIAMDRNGDLWVTLVAGQLLSVTGVPDTAPPTVTWIAPQYGAAGDEVTVTGTFLGSTQSVTVGGAPAAFEVIDPAHLSVTVPAGSGNAPVVVTTAHGTSPSDPGAVFHYGSPPPPPPVVSGVDPPSGPISGGNTITVTGTDLTAASIQVGGAAATGVSCAATSCTAVVPAGSLGTVHVRATTAAGTSTTSSADEYTYLAPAPPAPSVTGISPATGPTDGGTVVTVTGTNLADGSVWFGTAAASGTCSATSCTVTSPQSGSGVVHVRVSTAGGTSPKVAADKFTYVGSGSTASTTTVAASPTTAVVGDPVTFTAHVTPAAATGQVVFREGATALGTVDLAGGTAQLTTSSLPIGSHQVAAEYLGDDTYAGSTATPVTVTITDEPVLQPTTTTIEADPTTVHEGETVTLTAAVDPEAATGTVTFADDDGVLDEIEVVDGVAETEVFLEAGSHDIVASYSGDDGYEPSESDPVTVTVQQAQQTTTTLTAAPATAQLQSPVTFTATVAPAAATGTVTFVDDTTQVVLGHKTVSGGLASLTTTTLGTGQHKVYAFFIGSSGAYGFSQSAEVTVTITAPPPPPPPAAAPGAPQNVRAKASPHKKVTVQWAAPASPGSSPITKYVVLVQLGHKVVKKVETRGPALKLVVAHLKAGKKYRFAVYAVNSVGSGATSAFTKAVKVKR